MADGNIDFGVKFTVDVDGEEQIVKLKADGEDLKQSLGKLGEGLGGKQGILGAIFGAGGISKSLGGIGKLGRGLTGVVGMLGRVGVSASGAGAAIVAALGGPVGVAAVAAFAVGVLAIWTAFKILGSIIRKIGAVLKWLWGIAEQVLGAIGKLAGMAAKQLRKIILVSLAAAVALGAMGIKSEAVFAEFEQGLRNAMTVAGLFGDELEKQEKRMGQFARTVAAGSTKTATEVTTAFYALASAGLTVDEILASTRGTVALAEATQAEMGQTTELLTSTLKAFRLEASETNRVANAMAAAISASPLNMERLTHSMSFVAPVASQMNLAVEDTIALLGMLARQGITGSMAGTSLRMMMVRSLIPTKAASSALAKYGLTIDDVNMKAVGVAKAIENLGKLATGDIMRVFGVRAGPSASILAQQGASAFQDLRKEITGTNMAFQLQKLQLDTMLGQWTILKSEVTTSTIAFGDASKRGVMVFLRSMQQLVRELRNAGLFDALGRAFGQIAFFLAQLVQGAARKAPEFVEGLVQKLEKLPGILNWLLSKLPDVAEKLRNASEWFGKAKETARQFAIEGIGVAGRWLSWLGEKLIATGDWFRNEWPEIAGNAISISFDIGRAFLALGQTMQLVFELLFASMRPGFLVITGMLDAFLAAIMTATKAIGILLFASGKGDLARSLLPPLRGMRAERDVLQQTQDTVFGHKPDFTLFPRALQSLNQRERPFTERVQGFGDPFGRGLQGLGRGVSGAGEFATEVHINQTITVNDAAEIEKIAGRSAGEAIRVYRRGLRIHTAQFGNS